MSQLLTLTLPDGAVREVAPGTHNASSPAMRRQWMMTSCTALLRPCPTCSTAVTFGGGMTMVKGSRVPPPRVVCAGSAWNKPAASQAAYKARSVAPASYWAGMSEADGLVMRQVNLWN